MPTKRAICKTLALILMGLVFQGCQTYQPNGYEDYYEHTGASSGQTYTQVAFNQKETQEQAIYRAQRQAQALALWSKFLGATEPSRQLPMRPQYPYVQPNGLNPNQPYQQPYQQQHQQSPYQRQLNQELNQQSKPMDWGF